MKRSFERLVSGLLVAAMLVGLPVVSMASEWDTGDSVAAYSATEVNPVCNHNTDESNSTLKVKVVAPTCTKGGYTQFECKTCGQKYKGNYTPMLGHDYDGGVEKDGKMRYTCQRSGCSEHYSVELDDAGNPNHYHYDTVDSYSTCVAHVKDAKCKENSYGQTFYVCTICDYVQYDPSAYVAPLDHDFTEWQFVKESGMTNKGKASRSCRNCGFVETVKTANEEPYAQMGRITESMTPAYTSAFGSEIAVYLAKGVTFDYANVMYGSRYQVTSFTDVYGNSYSGTFYVDMSKVELDPGSVPIYSSNKGVQEYVTVTSNSRLNVYRGHTTDSALIKTLSKGDKFYVYRYESGNTWGRISATEDQWVQLDNSDLTRVPAFGFGSELSDLGDPDPDTPEVADVGTVTAASSTIVRDESNVSVGKLPKGTKINFYKSTETDKPFEKDSKGVITRGYIEESEAIRLGLSGAGYIDMTYVTLASGSKTPSSGSGNSSNSNSGNSVVATGVVTSSVNLNVRKKPEVSVLNLMGSLPTGTKLEFYEIGTYNGASWGKIKYNGKDGWVCMTYVQITSGNSTSIGSSNSQAKPNGTVANCSMGVNVRDTNSTQGKLLTTIAVNSRVAITKLKDGWGFVDGKGWVYMQYVNLDAGAEEAIKNGSNSSNNNNSNTDNTVKTYTNVTVLGEVVAGSKATIYSGTVAKPGTEQLTMMGGRQFTITDRTIVNGTVWYKTSAGGYTGWVADEGNITLPAIVGTVNVSSLNVYADRSTDSKVISTLVQNAQVSIDKNGQWTDGIYVWGKVRNTNGYVQMNNLKLVVQQTTDGISVGSTPITGKILRTLEVRKAPKDSAAILYEVEAKHTVTIDTWCYKEGTVWAKVTVGEEAGWIELTTGNVGQSTVSATVNVDKIELYTAAGDLNSKTNLTKRKNDKITVLERTLVDDTSVWGRIEVSGEDYWMNLAGTSLGTYSIVPTETTAPATTAPSGGNNSGSGSTTGTTTAVKGTICNTDSVNVRTGAGVSNALATTLTRGTVVTVYEQKTVDNALWGRIDQGWVAMSYVDLSAKTNTGTNSTVASGSLSGNTILTTVPSDAIAVGFVNTKNLNVRNGSGFGYTTTATLPQYTNVVVYEQILKDGVIWARIDQGWVCATYLTYTGLSVTGSGTAGTVARCFYTARVRANPGVSSALVGYVMVNSRLEIYEQQSYSGEMWGRTSIGWISMQYVLTDGSLPA